MSWVFWDWNGVISILETTWKVFNSRILIMKINGNKISGAWKMFYCIYFTEQMPGKNQLVILRILRKILTI